MDRPVCHKLSLKAFAICNTALWTYRRHLQGHSSQKEIQKDWIARWQLTRSGRMSWILWRGKGYVFILMESKWSRLRMILTVTCVHITWLGRCRWHSTWSCSGSVFQRLWSSWCYPESARVLWHCRVDHIFAVCCDTISSNTDVFSRAIVLLPQSWTLPPYSFS